MNLQQIIDKLQLKPLTNTKDFTSIIPAGGYASDLLSCVMTGAKNQDLWITLQAHINIVAVAALLDLCAIIITEGAAPDEKNNRKSQRGRHHPALHHRFNLCHHWQPLGYGNKSRIGRYRETRRACEKLPGPIYMSILFYPHAGASK